MIAWIIANAATLLIGTLLLILLVLAIRYTIRKAKEGKCMGCGACNMYNSADKDCIISCNSLMSNNKGKSN